MIIVKEYFVDVVQFKSLEKKLINLNDELVLIDKDVAELYKIEPKKLRQQLKRNSDKFPKSYAYRVSEEEFEWMVSQNVTPSKQSFGGSLPYVFTEKGLYMVATILKSPQATQATFNIIETFAKIKELSRNINALTKTDDKTVQKELSQKTSTILEDLIEIDEEYIDNDNEEIIETQTKFEFNLGFAKVTRNIKKIKK
jgi:hypothetical protein